MAQTLWQVQWWQVQDSNLRRAYADGFAVRTTGCIAVSPMLQRPLICADAPSPCRHIFLSRRSCDNAVTITVTVRDRFWAAGLDLCDVATLW
jgi:hypothetical protein